MRCILLQGPGTQYFANLYYCMTERKYLTCSIDIALMCSICIDVVHTDLDFNIDVDLEG